ncbi:MAG TPA: DMT family transporter [Azospirillum sp.]|nr:DMT family transporter [Azospirillum sp.]
MAAPRMGATEWLLLILLSVLWGGAFLFGKVAVAELRPFTVVLGRVGLAAVALLAIARASGLRLPTTSREWAPFFVLGLLNNIIPFSLIFWGQTQIASGLAAILNATTPLFGVVLAHLLTKDERLTAPRLTGVLLGLAGVVVIVGPTALAPQMTKGAGLNLLAQLAVLGAALSYGCAGIYGRRFRGTPPLVTAAGQLTASTLMILPIALLVDRPWEAAMPGAATWGALVGIALLGTAVAFVLYFRILATAGATNALLVTFLIPVSALLLGAVVLGEAIEPRQLAGMALIGLGLAVIDGRPLALLGRAATAS